MMNGQENIKLHNMLVHNLQRRGYSRDTSITHLLK